MIRFVIMLAASTAAFGEIDVPGVIGLADDGPVEAQRRAARATSSMLETPPEAMRSRPNVALQALVELARSRRAWPRRVEMSVQMTVRDAQGLDARGESPQP